MVLEGVSFCILDSVAQMRVEIGWDSLVTDSVELASIIKAQRHNSPVDGEVMISRDFARRVYAATHVELGLEANSERGETVWKGSTKGSRN